MVRIARSRSIAEKEVRKYAPFAAATTLLFVILLATNPSAPNNNSVRSLSADYSTMNLVDMKLAGTDAGTIWEKLVSTGKAGEAAFEVGMHVAYQCMMAAKNGKVAYCFEPSPKSFERVKKAVNEQPQDVKDRIHLYQNLVGPDSSSTLEFAASGGTGDHVGNADVWNMEFKPPTDPNLAAKQGQMVQVKSIAIDDVIEENDLQVRVIKVDTQGFEPAVFSGMIKSLQNYKIDYVLMEFWPAGMDLMAEKAPKTCTAARLLETLGNLGYHIYALSASSHPAAPASAKRALQTTDFPQKFDDYCQWFYELENKHPADYKMGYWADIVAVAPTVKQNVLV